MRFLPNSFIGRLKLNGEGCLGQSWIFIFDIFITFSLLGWRTGDCTKGKSLDEITNRVFEELLQGKAEASLATPSDQGSVRVSFPTFILLLYDSLCRKCFNNLFVAVRGLEL